MKKVANANERTASAAALNSITEELHFMVAESPDLDLLERYTLKKKKDNPKLVEDTYVSRGQNIYHLSTRTHVALPQYN